LADLQLHALREKLQATRPHAISIAKDLSEATEALQKAEYDLALAKVAAWGKTAEKSATGRKTEVEMSTLLEKADVDQAQLALRLVLSRKDLFETMVSALQSEVKTHEIEARFS
jgi:hypothetical protein